MANEQVIGGDNSLFVGEDKTFTLTVVDVLGVPVNIASWDILLDIRKVDASSTPIISKPAAVVGAYDIDPLQNTQRAVVALTDDDMNLFKAQSYRYSFKRMTDGNETVLAFGDFLPQKATAP
jgi:hypothetical protein